MFLSISDKEESVYSPELPHSISKRSVDEEQKKPPLADRVVETLVVADKNLYLKHGDQNITTYTLTLFNMVRFVVISAFFCFPSLHFFLVFVTKNVSETNHFNFK